MVPRRKRPREAVVFDYLPNDSATSDIFMTIPLPRLSADSPEITVVGLKPRAKAVPGTAEAQAAQVYASVVFALNAVQSFIPSPIRAWAATENLVAIPRAGEQKNAMYDRSSLRFFYWKVPGTMRTAYACDSADVVSHETGHAILDALRPELWNMQSLEVAAYHESFGDMVAVLAALQHGPMVARVLAETGGDLRKHNSAERVAEELGAALATTANGTAPQALREAVNRFTYTPPESLPERAGPDQLSRDPHRFGLVFLGAFWDLLVHLYEKFRAAGLDAAAAIEAARVRTGRLVLAATLNAKARPKFMSSVARQVAQAEADLYGGEHAAAITDIFNARGLICNVPFAQQYGSDGLTAVQPMEKPQRIEVSVPRIGTVNAYMAAADGCIHEEALIDCNAAVEWAFARGLVGFSDSMFMVANGHLVRNFICQREAWPPTA